MDRERPKEGDLVRPIGWHQKMIVVAIQGGDIRCRWNDDDGEHEQDFPAGQLETVRRGADFSAHPERSRVTHRP
ncbi:hypothetical protein IP91_04666 [Pseudoduganella lurida]|uniref:DUF2158 domain-containing protein n=1 Tax=Pseudoduganella lurida TaxID=1036180 RepID=A0A562QXS6_9BURK|nr:hypothetical protein [Pseudoduganella lurida]TWI61585.1 hypothetical protein IP91_04666 [Pseudoduganella lurida]